MADTPENEETEVYMHYDNRPIITGGIKHLQEPELALRDLTEPWIVEIWNKVNELIDAVNALSVRGY